MTQNQRTSLQRAAWNHRADLERVILADIENQQRYKHALAVYRRPSMLRKVPKSVWVFLAAAVLAVIILAF